MQLSGRLLSGWLIKACTTMISLVENAFDDNAM
jgi:hypothetical protein